MVKEAWAPHAAPGSGRKEAVSASAAASGQGRGWRSGEGKRGSGTRARSRLLPRLWARRAPRAPRKHLTRALPGAGGFEAAPAAGAPRSHRRAQRRARRPLVAAPPLFPWQPLGNKHGGASSSTRRKWGAPPRPAPGAGGHFAPRRSRATFPQAVPAPSPARGQAGFLPPIGPSAPGLGKGHAAHSVSSPHSFHWSLPREGPSCALRGSPPVRGQEFPI